MKCRFLLFRSSFLFSYAICFPQKTWNRCLFPFIISLVLIHVRSFRFLHQLSACCSPESFLCVSYSRTLYHSEGVDVIVRRSGRETRDNDRWDGDTQRGKETGQERSKNAPALCLNYHLLPSLRFHFDPIRWKVAILKYRQLCLFWPLYIISHYANEPASLLVSWPCLR